MAFNAKKNKETRAELLRQGIGPSGPCDSFTHGEDLEQIAKKLDTLCVKSKSDEIVQLYLKNPYLKPSWGKKLIRNIANNNYVSDSTSYPCSRFVECKFAKYDLKNMRYEQAILFLRNLVAASEDYDSKEMYKIIGRLILKNKFELKDSEKFLLPMTCNLDTSIEPILEDIYLKKPELRHVFEKGVKDRLIKKLANHGEYEFNDGNYDSVLRFAEFYLAKGICQPEEVLLPAISPKNLRNSKRIKFLIEIISKYDASKCVSLLIRDTVEDINSEKETNSDFEFLDKALDRYTHAVLDGLNMLKVGNNFETIIKLHSLTNTRNLPELEKIVANYVTNYVATQTDCLFSDATDERCSTMRNFITASDWNTQYVPAQTVEAAYSVLLEDGDAQMRANAVKVIGIVGEKEIDKVRNLQKLEFYLIENLQDKSRDVRANTAEAIGKIGHVDPLLIANAVPYLSRMDEQASDCNVHAFKALEKIAKVRFDLVAPYLKNIMHALDKQFNARDKRGR